VGVRLPPAPPFILEIKMDRDPVNSTSIRSIGYDSESKKMEVEFLKGTVYTYSDVSDEVYNTLMTSESIGKAFSSLIKAGGFSYEKTE
tara:strand:- start:271 stop:534 length:264 start_codon:yes stop_codon:yes gene_type:complete